MFNKNYCFEKRDLNGILKYRGKNLDSPQTLEQRPALIQHPPLSQIVKDTLILPLPRQWL